MPSVHGRRKGDILVRVQIETPKRVSKQMEKILRELAEIEEENVTPQREGFLKKLKSYFSE
jgi:molecular chaperone DnaJ